jgi:hypothetical protein
MKNKIDEEKKTNLFIFSHTDIFMLLLIYQIYQRVREKLFSWMMPFSI